MQTHVLTNQEVVHLVAACLLRLSLSPISLASLPPLLLSFSVVRPRPLPILSVRPLSLSSRERSCQGATLRRARKRATCTLARSASPADRVPTSTYITRMYCGSLSLSLSLSLDSRFRSILVDVSSIHKLKYFIAARASRPVNSTFRFIKSLNVVSFSTL